MNPSPTRTGSLEKRIAPLPFAARIFSFRRLCRWCHIPSVPHRNHSLVNFPQKRFPGCRARGFTLIEILVTITIIVILMAAGVSLLGGTGPQARRSATDILTGMIEQARTTAVTTRYPVVLAIVEPGDFPANDGKCRIGLFEVKSWPMPIDPKDDDKPRLIGRWRILENNVVLIGGQAESGLANPLDQPKVTLDYGKKEPVNVYAIVFSPRGGLHPTTSGQEPIAIRVAEGAYRNGVAKPKKRGNVIPENLIRIGRVTARPYRIDG
jgi:prepilin-type N-terminal cleavage/methylation domain-containing protein